MFFLVTGASGVGKSTVRKLIEPEFAGVLEAAELGMLGSTPDWMRRHVVDSRHRPEVITGNAWPQMRWERWVGSAASQPPWSSHIIETSELDRAAVAHLVAQWLRHHIHPPVNKP